ncbi:hypothetical protein DQ04_09841010 [Trypanosoma grayi]|uniref:hypothetical protein n=1 Tax=Trypanosoma grayi TaxID=71804 RepID=UPI0004F3FB28|nr:hypothetical protein DQ04_09841010 [Trypanosoma grayi]KEG07427.1 hypothetical protein DQ04_09841010 [Trypanosoma grayi]
MLRGSSCCLAKRFRYNTKYPSLVSYNKLPWELLNHETPEFHMHVAPHYEQVLSLATSTQVPHLISKQHLDVPPEHRLRLLPGMLYVLEGDVLPAGFSDRRVLDPTALQYYGRIDSTVASVVAVRMLISDDLRLLCNSVTLRWPPRLPVAPHAALASLQQADANATFTLFHYVRPNRPPSELQLEKYYIHVPHTTALDEFSASNPSGSSWEPRLQAPKRSTRVTPLPAYRPPQSYLMGLAERLAVVPGSSFGRRSLMWGHWF